MRFHSLAVVTFSGNLSRFALLLLFILAGCRTAATRQPVDLTQPGWTLQKAQAIWKPKRDAPEIVGELLLATRGANASFLQFSKTPFPLVEAQTDTNGWQIHFQGMNRSFSGKRNPPAEIIWFQLSPALRGETLPSSWSWQNDGERWRLENRAGDEYLEGAWVK